MAAPTSGHATRWKIYPDYTKLGHHPAVKPLLSSYKPGTIPPRLLIKALLQAQLDCCEGRTRSEASLSSSVRIKDRTPLETALREGMRFPPPNGHSKSETPKESAPAVVVQQEPAAPAPAPAPAPAAAPTLPVDEVHVSPELLKALGCFLDTFANDLTHRLTAQMNDLVLDIARQLVTTNKQSIESLLGGKTEEPTPAPGVPEFRAKLLRSRVDIIGLLNGQAEIVRQHMGQMFDLRFLSAEDAKRQPITAPTAILLTKFVNHACQDAIKKKGATLVFANGGVESVIKSLQRLQH